MSSSKQTTRQNGTENNNLFPLATVYNNGSMYNVIGDLNLNNHNYNAPQQDSARDRLLKRSCSRATFNGDIRIDTPKCHPDTRRSIIMSIKFWALDISLVSYLFWLKGSVGTGKSAVASRVCEELDDTDPALLAGSFFFWRNDNDRSSLKSFVATIAYRICVVMPEVGKAIDGIISRDPSILDTTIEYQWVTLVIKPLCQTIPSNATRRSLIVIDGLDECEPSSSQRQLLHLLTMFHQYGLSHRFAFLICSRPEAHIQYEMGLLATRYPTHFWPSLMLSETEESREDIEVILRSGFDLIYLRRRSIIGHPQWPPEGAINRIIALARGQFIYVSTVLRWLGDDEGHPAERLDSIFESFSPQRARAFAPIDQLYDTILTSARAKEAGDLVLPCLLLLTLTYRDGNPKMNELWYLSDFLEKDPSHLQLALQPLHSVLRGLDAESRQEAWEPGIQVYHTSFVATPLMTRAIVWASSDPKDYSQYVLCQRYLFLWLDIGASIPEDSIMLTPDLLDALARMNVKRWLRTRALFWNDTLVNNREAYNAYRQRLVRLLPKEEMVSLNQNFPYDLFPPFDGGWPQYVFRCWAKDCQSGVLSTDEVVLFLCIIYSHALVEFRKSVESDVAHFDHFGAVINHEASHGHLLLREMHACKARDLVLNTQTRLALESRDTWVTFLYNAEPDEYPFDINISISRRLNNKISMNLDEIEFINSFFTPMEILYCYLVSSWLASMDGFWRNWKIIRNSQPRIEVDRLTLLILQGVVKRTFLPLYNNRAYDCYDVHKELSRLIEYFGDIAPAPLLRHWCHPESIDFSERTVAQMTSMIEELVKYPIKCRCDELLGLNPGPVTTSSSPWSAALTFFSSLFCWT